MPQCALSLVLRSENCAPWHSHDMSLWVYFRHDGRGTWTWPHVWLHARPLLRAPPHDDLLAAARYSLPCLCCRSLLPSHVKSTLAEMVGAMSTSTPPSSRGIPASSPASPAWTRAASVLLVGGVLAFIATFLPLGTAVYPNDPAPPIVTVPAEQLATALRFNLQNPASSSISSTLGWAALLWGIPISLMALGAALLLWRHRVRVPRMRPRQMRLVLVLGLVLGFLGAGFTLLSIEFYRYPFFGLQGWTRSLEYGAAVAVCGYLCALVGLVWLLSLSLSRRTQPLP
jgi:hypothetical protein